MNETLAVLDLFSGIGGFALGLDRATYPDGMPGFRTAAFCEQNDYAGRVLGRHWPGVPLYRDVRDVTARALELDGIPRIDVVCGGFPCQDISLAGNGAGLNGARSGLWFEMLRIIAETRPRFVIAENVSALRSRGLDVVLGGLASVGYDAEWHCIPAASIGAPHRRDRVWVIAYPNGQSEHACAVNAEMGGAPEPLDHAERIGRGAGRNDNAEHDRQQLGAASADAGALADADGARLEGHRRAIREGAENARPRDVGQNVADADGCPGGRDSGGFPAPEGAPRGEPDAFGPRAGGGGILRRIDRDGAQWNAEPDVGRVADGVPSRVDRLRCLGNAVVPQIPEMIGRAILLYVQRVSIPETP